MSARRSYIVAHPPPPPPPPLIHSFAQYICLVGLQYIPHACTTFTRFVYMLIVSVPWTRLNNNVLEDIGLIETVCAQRPLVRNCTVATVAMEETWWLLPIMTLSRQLHALDHALSCSCKSLGYSYNLIGLIGVPHAWFPALRFRSSVSVSVKPCPYCGSVTPFRKRHCRSRHIGEWPGWPNGLAGEFPAFRVAELQAS